MGKEIHGCMDASRFLRDKRNAPKAFHHQTIRTAVLNAELRSLNADEFGLRGSRYLFDSDDLLDWSYRKTGGRCA